MRSLILLVLSILSAAVLTVCVWCGVTYGGDLSMVASWGLFAASAVAMFFLWRSTRMLLHRAVRAWDRRNDRPETPEEQEARAERYRRRAALEREEELELERRKAYGRVADVLRAVAEHSQGGDLLTGLNRLVNATGVTADLQCIRQLEDIAADVIETMREDEPQLFVGYNSIDATNRFETAFTVRLQHLSIRATPTQFGAVRRYASRLINRAMHPPSESPPTSSPTSPRADVGGGAS